MNPICLLIHQILPMPESDVPPYAIIQSTLTNYLADHHVQLNNYVQQMFNNSTSLSSQAQQLPEHRLGGCCIQCVPSTSISIIICKIVNHVEYGRATASRKHMAAEAARQAPVNLQGH